MYFKSRVEAGQLLAKQIVQRYKGEGCVVIALGDGGVMVGAQIALELHCPLTLLLTELIKLPREDAAVAGVSQDGSVAYNQKYSQTEIDEFLAEYYHYIEQEKMNKLYQIHRASGHGGLIDKDLLRDRQVVLVSDGLPDGFALDLALQFLKPIRINKLIVATPLASVPAVDRMHVLADEIFCLSVIEDYISTEHYYEAQDVPDHEKVLQIVQKLVEHWKAVQPKEAVATQPK